jgi:hypothetical protein
MDPLFDPGNRPEDLEVQVSELLVATADTSDERGDQSITHVLRLLPDSCRPRPVCSRTSLFHWYPRQHAHRAGER